MIAVPPSLWPELAGRSASEASAMLLDLALRVPMERMLRNRRGNPRAPYNGADPKSLEYQISRTDS